MIKNNRIVVDLNKVQFAHFYYINQWGNKRETLPKDKSWFSVRNEPHYKTEMAMYHAQYPSETLYDRAKRLETLDVWMPEIMFKLQANSTLIYTGKKAVAMHKAWNTKIFKST